MGGTIRVKEQQRWNIAVAQKYVIPLYVFQGGFLLKAIHFSVMPL